MSFTRFEINLRVLVRVRTREAKLADPGMSAAFFWVGTGSGGDCTVRQSFDEGRLEGGE